MKKGKRVAIYVRPGTNGKTWEAQVEELSAMADERGWTVTAKYIERGPGRTEFDAVAAVAREGETDLIMFWSVYRLGHSSKQVLCLLGDIVAHGVDIFISCPEVDTTTRKGRADFDDLDLFMEPE